MVKVSDRYTSRDRQPADGTADERCCLSQSPPRIACVTPRSLFVCRFPASTDQFNNKRTTLAIRLQCEAGIHGANDCSTHRPGASARQDMSRDTAADGATNSEGIGEAGRSAMERPKHGHTRTPASCRQPRRSTSGALPSADPFRNALYRDMWAIIGPLGGPPCGPPSVWLRAFVTRPNPG